MRRWSLVCASLMLAACSEGDFSVDDPGSGDPPAASITRMGVGTRYQLGQDDVMRVEAGLRDGQVRLVTPDDVHVFESSDGRLLWRGSARLGTFRSPAVLVPAELRNGMRWQTSDGAFRYYGTANTDGSGGWQITLERNDGIYADPDRRYTADFSFVEGVGITRLSVTDAEGLTPLDGRFLPRYSALLTRRRATTWTQAEGFSAPPSFDAPTLDLTAVEVSTAPGCGDRIATTTANGTTVMQVHGRERFWQAPGVGADVWVLGSEDRAFCIQHAGDGFTECAGATSGTFEESDASPDQRLRWPGGFLLGAFDRDAPRATLANPARDLLAYQGRGRIWGAGRYDFEASEHRWPFSLGFARAGHAQRHHSDDGRAEALIAQADGMVFRARVTDAGVEQELLGVVDLPEGRFLGGVARLGEPNGDAEGSTLLVTTCTRLSPFPFHELTPSTTEVWTTTLPAPTVVPAREADAVIADATSGIVACSLGETRPTRIEVDGIELPLEDASQFGSCRLGVRDKAPIARPLGVVPASPGAATVEFGAGRRVHFVLEGPGEDHPSIGGPDTPAYIHDDGSLSRTGSFDRNGLPNGPGAAEQLGIPPDETLLDTVTGAFVARGITGMEHEHDGAAAGGGFFGWGGGQVHWTDGEGEEWTADLPGTAGNVFVWADGRVCTHHQRQLRCRGADGETRTRIVDAFIGGAPDSRAQFALADGWLVLDNNGATTLEPDTATVTHIGRARPFRDQVDFVGQTPEAVYYFDMPERRLVRAAMDGEQSLRIPSSHPYQGGWVRPVRTGRLAGPIQTGIQDDMLEEVIFVFDEEPLGPPVLPPPTTYMPGDVVGEFVVGDVGVPATATATRGRSPVFVELGSFSASRGPVLPRYGDAGYERITATGRVILNGDGSDGTPVPFSSAEAPFDVLDHPLASADGRYLALYAEGGTPAAPPALMRLDRMTGTETIVGTGAGGGGYGSIGLDGSMLYFVQPPTPGNVNLRVRDAAGSTQDVAIPAIPNSLALAPGGGWFAWSDGTDAHLVRADGEAIGDITGVERVAFDPTGGFLATHSAATGLIVYALGAGPLPTALARLTTAALPTGAELWWSPAGDVLIAEGLGNAEVVRIDAAGAGVVQTLTVPANARMFFLHDGAEVIAVSPAAPAVVTRFGAES